MTTTSKKAKQDLKNAKLKLHQQFQTHHKAMNDLVTAAERLIEWSNQVQRESKNKNPDKIKLNQLNSKYQVKEDEVLVPDNN